LAPPFFFINPIQPFYVGRISSLVSDTFRSCFYALTAKNSISIYRTAGDKSIEHIQTIGHLYKLAQDKAPGASALTPQNFTIISLHVVHPNESRSGIQLIAITTTGVRLYFSPTSAYNHMYGGMASAGSSLLRPLHLIHVRLPPSNLMHPEEQIQIRYHPIAPYGVPQPSPSPSARTYVVSTLDASCYSEGLTICAQPGDTDGYDFILCTSPDLTRIGTLGQTGHSQQQSPATAQQPSQQSTWADPSYSTSGSPRPPLAEYAALLNITGRTWAIAAVPISQLSASSELPTPAITNELSTQFSEPAKQFHDFNKYRANFPGQKTGIRLFASRHRGSSSGGEHSADH
jgi:nuclear pore complex protein Nup155